MIVQGLHEIQKRHGYLRAPDLEALATRLGVPLHRLHEVATFFPHYRLEPPPAVEVKVCRDMACHLRGAPELRRGLEETARALGGKQVEVTRVSCLGQCDAPPAVLINEQVHRGKSLAEYQSLLRKAAAGRPVASRWPERAGKGWRIDPYCDGRPPYEAARRFAAKPDAAALIGELKVADLRGMGGAGVWAYQKWADVREARGGEKYVVCNGDESEPGTFKDRELLLHAPHLVVEGVILAGLLVGARKGFLYIRHEYDGPIEAVRRELERARELGACGANVFGTGRSFPVEVFVSPGGYICGEQSALIEAMEDRRAEPRNKPPMLETNGLYDKPTLVSNVETFAWAPAIALRGGAWYRDQGVGGGQGLRFFSISGDVVRPGAYEVPNGLPLRALIRDYAGGMRGGQQLKAVAPSGPSGGFLPARLPAADLPERFVRDRLPAGATHLDVLDLPLDLQAFRDLGLMLGAGIVVYGDRADMLDQALNCTRFFRNESCGKCVPCRLGSQRLVEIASSLRKGRVIADDLPRVEGLVSDLLQSMGLTAICGLGMVAGNPLASVLRYFRDDVERHLIPSDI
jgi:formate dehydrogenase beta subunit